MQSGGVAQHIATAAGEWLVGLSTHRDDLAGPFEHSYDLSAVDIHGEGERGVINALCNALQAKGATQRDVEAVLGWYKTRPTIAARDIELRAAAEEVDQGHAKEVEVKMRGEWGPEYGTNIRLINRHLDGLPAKDREAIEGRMVTGGRRALNDPATLLDLAIRARGGAIPTDAVGLQREIKQLETYMRENRSKYDKDLASQARLRDLYRARG